jgi:hypothetical protein
MWYGGAHGGFYETLTSLVYFALLATPLPATNPGAHASCLTLSPPCSLQPSPPSHSASLMPSSLSSVGLQHIAKTSRAHTQAPCCHNRYAPIRLRFEHLCLCEFKSDANPVVPILIPNLIQNLIPASLPLRRIANMDCDGL